MSLPEVDPDFVMEVNTGFMAALEKKEKELREKIPALMRAWKNYQRDQSKKLWLRYQTIKKLTR